MIAWLTPRPRRDRHEPQWRHRVWAFMKKHSIDPKMAANFLKNRHPKCLQYLTNESVLHALNVVLYDADRRGYCPDIIDTSQSAGRMPMKTEAEHAPCITSGPLINAMLWRSVCIVPCNSVLSCELWIGMSRPHGTYLLLGKHNRFLTGWGPTRARIRVIRACLGCAPGVLSVSKAMRKC
jgi:hypothetical protein